MFRRQLLNFLTALSLPLCLAVAALWVRGYWVTDLVGWVIPRPDGGRVTLWLCSGRGGIGFTVAEVAGGLLKDTGPEWRQRTPPQYGGADWAQVASGDFGFYATFRRYPIMGVRLTGACVPTPLLALVPVIPLALSAWRRRIKISGIGLCEKCGYDLRATPDRCPECGETVATPSKVNPMNPTLPRLVSVVLLVAAVAPLHLRAADPPAAPSTNAAAELDGDWAKMRPIVPRGYVCGRARMPLVIDGRGDEPSWAGAAWTEDFKDIEGDARPAPRFRTRAKMLWDDDCFYVFAELEEPHVWGTITRKNQVIFQDNDFEVFIDPDGDHHHYYEFEMNALNTVWELTLEKPYRDGGPARDPANIDGLRSAVHVNGTPNNPADTDRSWSVEIAIPWKGLARYAGRGACPPRDGDQWRANFSRVEWLVDIIDGKYRKIPKEMRPEDNWVWSPQGVIDMHRPERWGYVQFSSSPATATFRPDPTLPARDLLMTAYHRQREFHKRTGHYARSAAELGLDDTGGAAGRIDIILNGNGYTATTRLTPADDRPRALHVADDSRVWQD